VKPPDPAPLTSGSGPKAGRYPTLADVGSGRDNNFNLLRFVASLLVVLTHGIALSTGNVEVTPLHVFGGFVAVLAPDVFFVASGYLITASLMGRNDAAAYVRARVLRIYPALWVSGFATVFGIGLLVTTLPALDYLTHPQTWIFLVRNLTLVAGASESLPGVFNGLPYPNSVNGSLWTLPVEIRLYLGLLLLWWLAGRFTRQQRPWMGWVMVAGAVLLGVLKLRMELGHLPTVNTLRLAPLFFIGSAFYLFREHVAIRRDWFWLALGAMLLSAPWRPVFQVVELLTIGYVTLYLAYVPDGAVRQFNRLGDYSYGIYIHSFPLQQCLVLAMPGIGPWATMAASLMVSVPVAVASWHWIEKPAISRKRKVPAPSP